MLSTCLKERVNVSLKTVLSRINLPDARHQVVQVGLCTLEHIIAARTVLASTVLPALALMSDLPGWNDMLPFDACGTVGIFAWDVPAGFQIHPVAGVFTAAVKLCGLWGIELPGDFLGLAEGSRRLGVGGNGKKQTKQSSKANTH